MRVRLTIVGVCLAAVGVLGSACAPAPPPQGSARDQFNKHPSAGNYGSVLVGQSFTAGRTGWLDRVSMPYWECVLPCSPGAPSTVITIQTVDAQGLPTGVVIGGVETTMPTNTGPNGPFLDFYLDTPAPVQAGVQYAIVIGTMGYVTGQVEYSAPSLGGTYPGGTSLTMGYQNQIVWGSDDSRDLLFETWVSS